MAFVDLGVAAVADVGAADVIGTVGADALGSAIGADMLGTAGADLLGGSIMGEGVVGGAGAASALPTLAGETVTGATLPAAAGPAATTYATGVNELAAAPSVSGGLTPYSQALGSSLQTTAGNAGAYFDSLNAANTPALSSAAANTLANAGGDSALSSGFDTAMKFMGDHPILTGLGIYGAANMLGLNKPTTYSTPGSDNTMNTGYYKLDPSKFQPGRMTPVTNPVKPSYPNYVQNPYQMASGGIAGYSGGGVPGYSDSNYKQFKETQSELADLQAFENMMSGQGQHQAQQDPDWVKSQGIVQDADQNTRNLSAYDAAKYRLAKAYANAGAPTSAGIGLDTQTAPYGQINTDPAAMQAAMAAAQQPSQGAAQGGVMGYADGGALGSIIGTPMFQAQQVANTYSQNPEQALLGINTPAETYAWNNALGTNYQPTVNMYGGPTERDYAMARQQGVDMTAGHVADSIVPMVASAFGSPAAGMGLSALNAEGAAGERDQMLQEYRSNPSAFTSKYGYVKGVNGYASGGIAGYSLGGYAAGGNPRLLEGPGDGMSDNIPAVIGNRQPARLADGEFVVPADVVSHLGNGSTKAGAKKLHKMMNKVRVAKTGTVKQAPDLNMDKYIPT